MKRRLLAVVIGLGLVAFSGWAQTSQTVNYSGGTGIGSRNVVDSQGNPIPFGNEVEIGFFPTSFDVTNNASTGIGSLQTLWANWHEFGSTSFRSFFPDNTTGEFSAASTLNPGNPIFDGQRIYMWIFETSDNLAPNTTTWANVLEYGLFTAYSTANAGAWVFPRSTDLFPSPTSITTQDIDKAFFGGILSGSLQLLPVPEPSGVAILGLGLAVVLGRRFRR